MSNLRAGSSPDFLPSSDTDLLDDDLVLQGAASKVRLLLKLVQDYEADLGKAQCSMAGILCVLDEVTSGLERFHAPARRRKAELRRCSTDLCRSGEPPLQASTGKGPGLPETTTVEENQRLRKELSASLTMQKNLQKIKAQELQDIEEHLSDVKAQNERLLEKVRLSACEQYLIDRNNTLSEQLIRTLDGYRALKRKVKDLQEEKAKVQEKVAEMAARMSKGFCHIRDFCRRLATGMGNAPAEDDDVEEDISSIENVLRGLMANMSSAVAGRVGNMEFPKAGCGRGSHRQWQAVGGGMREREQRPSSDMEITCTVFSVLCILLAGFPPGEIFSSSLLLHE
ncbi:unnamed protein product [Spirodela intermedia]|uniref:Uncharacterized protein n=1 Tax=Spirodela intermedia TaxID=51605 RepID=A0A7I8JNN3_SPIIN|nr:unnamed protein product [Spirodela intermedia]CAA6671778.1 unnamed protein product [Spirodela intermedia]